MSSSGGGLRHFTTRILQTVALVLPALAFVLVVLHFAGDDSEPPASAAVTVVVQANVQGPTEAAFADAKQPADTQHVMPAKPARKDPPSTDPPTTPIVWALRGKSVEIHDAPDGSLVATQGPETEFGSPTVFSVQEEKQGWLGVSTPLMANGELGWIRADLDTLGVGYVDLSIEVDLSDRTSTLRQGDEVLRSWPVTVGAAESTTPTGTYAVTDTFLGGLNPVYGCCAVAISATQPNLPSTWMGGNRIAFHGTGGPLGVAASNGCIRSADEDVRALVETVPLGTPVTIRD